MSDFPDIESRLRESLAEHARRAPDGALLAEQVISTVTPPVRPLRRWRTWSLPLITAGAVAAVAGAVVGVVHATHSAAPRPVPPATTGSATVTSAVPSAPTPLPSVTTSVPHSSAPPADSAAAIDLTFVADDGWAITQDGLLLRSTDDAATWTRVGTVPPDVAHLRFATTSTGYAFGQDVLYLTRDGGMTWTKQDGGALALETLDNNVIRLVDDHSGCPGPCNIRAEIAPIGSSHWQAVALGGSGHEIDAGAVKLSRTGHYAFVQLVIGHAGSLQSEPLYVSTDDGLSWVPRTDPCSTVGAAAAGIPMGATDMSPAGDGSITLLCQGADSAVTTVSSTDGGASFVPGAVHQFGCCGAFPIMAASSTTLLTWTPSLQRSTDGGHTWKAVAGTVPANDPRIDFAGFETAELGHVMTGGGTDVWTTKDAGLTWTRAVLP